MRLYRALAAVETGGPDMTDVERDYAAEMREVIDQHTALSEPYVSRTVAREIVEKLSINDPDLLQGWLDAHAEQLIWAAINQRDRSHRAYARVANSRSVFAAAAAQAEGGDTAALGHWLSCRYVIADGTRSALANLTRADLLFVAERYDERSKANAFEAVFMRALAKKVRNGRVSDHFTDEQIATLRDSLPQPK